MEILIWSLIVPIIAAAVIIILPLNLRLLNFAHIAFSLMISAYLCCLVGKFLLFGEYFAFNQMLFLDALGSVFLVLIAIVALCANIYATSYFRWQLAQNLVSIKQIRLNFALAHIASFAMILSSISNNIAIMWAAIEATTLSTAFMVALKRDKKSLESGYKYIVICSVGLAFAMFATILLYSVSFNTFKDESSAMLFSYIIAHANELNFDAMKLIFILALVGFGTKAGLVPTHTWLPDAHAQGPVPTSAMLSGIVIKCAMLALIRYYAIALNAVGATFVESVMIISGTLTLFLAAFFLIRQHDIKRMFAYHSIAHMGVIAFALGVGGKFGLMAAVFHCAAHSFTKALAFITTGNTWRIYGTKIRYPKRPKIAFD